MIDKQKALARQQRWRKRHPNWQQKYRARRPEHFRQYDRQRYLMGGLKRKLREFCRKDYPIDPNLTIQNLTNKIGSNPHCYLTGEPINLNDITTYSLDHIVPISRGGDCSLSNCGLTTRVANTAKNNMTTEEFISFCRHVCDYQATKLVSSKKDIPT